MKQTIKIILLICIVILIISLGIKFINKSDHRGEERDFEREKLVLSIIEEGRNNDMGQGDEYSAYWAPKQKILDEETDNLFIRYLGKKYYEELNNNISKDLEEHSGKESSKKLIREAIKLYNGNKLTDYERELLKYIFEEIYFSVSIEDNELANELKTTGIEFK